MERYIRNGIISNDEQRKLKAARVCIVGCGGLGGYIIEMLARFGVGHLTVVDGDTFQESNLNRQILSSSRTLGKMKAVIAGDRVKEINPEVTVNVITSFVNKDNVRGIIAEQDVVLDALDSNDMRGIVMAACAEKGVPYVYGAIAGWYGQVATIFPEDTFVKGYLGQIKNHGVESNIGNPSFTPACVASIQVSETIKLLLGKGSLLREQILFIDLLNNEVEQIRVER